MAETYPAPRFGAPREPKSPVNPGSRLVSMFDIATASHVRAVGFLLLCALLLFLPGFFTIPPVDRDEARFAQATKQMVESGDYVDIRFQEDVRYKKPVGIYWLQSAAVETASALGLPKAELRIWVYRLPSLIGAIGAVLMTYWTALGFVTRRAAVLAALLMCASVLLGVEARLAKTHAMLLFCVVAAMGAMARAYLSWQRAEDETHPPWSWPAIFWTALAVGILIKGPLILMFAGLTIIALAIQDRDASWLWKLRPLWGLMWMLVLVLPWFVAIFWRAGDAFFADSVGGDMLSKLGAQESHGAPPGLYLALFWITFWPGAPLAAMAAPAVWRTRREPGAQFLLAWLIPSWLVFEVVMTKLPHYVLPLYPAIAILIAGILEHGGLVKTRWLVRGTLGWFAFPSLIAIAVGCAFIYFGRDLGLIAWPFAAVAAVSGLFAWWLYDVDGAERSLLRGMMASLFVAITVYGVTFSSLPVLFPSALIADDLAASGCNVPHVAATGYYQEPSLIFLLGTGTRFTDGGGAAQFLQQGWCRFALIDARSERSFVQHADALGLRYALVERVEGFNISIGRPVALAIFRSVA